jgi:DNA-binding CsgD family transcriptional regulator
LTVVGDELVRGGSVVVAGATGVGKSSLVATTLDRLRSEGRPTVVVRATRSTASIPFGAFARWVPERLADTRQWLGVLRGTAAELLAVPKADGDPDQGLVVVVVDDAQLLDEGSAALVLHLAAHTPASVLVTVRTGEPCPDAVEALGKEGLARRVDLAPLAEHQATELAERLLGGPLVAPARRRLWQLTAGNPLYVHEVVDAAQAQGVLMELAGKWRWQGTLAGSDRLAELVSQRLAAGSAGERRVLELIALGEPLPVDVLAELADGDLLADIERRGLVVTERASASRPDDGESLAVRLAHPIYSEVVRSGLLPFTARGHHRDLATAAIAAGLHRRVPLRVATWLLESGDQPAHPDLLQRAAVVAQILDEFELSARLSEAAVAAGAGPLAQVAWAEALGPLGRTAEAEQMLVRLAGPDHNAQVRAAALTAASELAFWHRGEELDVARRMLRAAVGSLPPAARSALMVQEARMAVTALDLTDAERLATAALEAAGSLNERLHALSCLSLIAVLQGRTSRSMRLLAELAPDALELAEDDPVPGSFAAATYSFASVAAGHIDEAVWLYTRLAEHQIVGMYGHMQGYPTFCVARAQMAQGRMATATGICREVLDLIGDHNHYGRGNWVAATLAMAAAQSGDRQTAARAVGWLEEHLGVVAEIDRVVVQLGQAWWRASQGEVSTARELALEVAEQAGKTGAFQFELMALHEVARLGDADAVTARLDELVEPGGDDHVDGPYAAAVARFARAMAAGSGAGLDQAAADFEAMGTRLLAAEAAAAAATAHRAAGKKRLAAASLALAQRMADACEGAVTPLLTAHLGPEPPAAALSRREREVAELAARGRTSREIAEALSVSVRTVDSHLDHAYTKLGITSRRELPAALNLDP